MNITHTLVTDRVAQTERNKDDIMMQGSDRQTDGARAAVWLHVFTAEHKLKKPRPLSHTPLGPKLYGVLHSTHKQPPGNVWKRQRDSGRTGEKQQLPFQTSTMPLNYRERLLRPAMGI